MPLKDVFNDISLFVAFASPVYTYSVNISTKFVVNL